MPGNSEAEKLLALKEEGFIKALFYTLSSSACESFEFTENTSTDYTVTSKWCHCYLERNVGHNTYFQKCDEIILAEEPLSPLDLAIIIKGENISTLEPDDFLNKKFQAEVVPGIFFKYQEKEKDVKLAQDLGMTALTVLSFAVPGTVMVRAIVGGRSLVAVISGAELLGSGLSEVASTKECATYLTTRYGQTRASTIMGTMHSFSLLSGNLNAPVKAVGFAEDMADIAKKLPYEDVNVFAKAAGEIEQNAEALIKNGNFTREQIEKIKNTNKFVRSDLAKVGKTVGAGGEVVIAGKWLSKFDGLGLTDDLVKKLTKKFDDLGFTEAQVDNFISDIVKGGDNFVLEISKNEGLVDSWKYLDEAGVDETLRRNIDALADPDAALDAIQISQKAKPTWPEIQALFKRGNDFNKKGRFKYGDNFVEVVLKGVDGKAGKRLDAYISPANGQAGQIISRKATTLSEIQPNTFRNYLNELITKYPKGAELNSSKFPSGTTLDGDYFLEIPTSNKSFFESSAEFQKVLSDFNTAKGVDIKIKYLDE